MIGLLFLCGFPEGAEIGMCGICEELYQAGGEVTKLLPSCTHLFHTICIEPWLKMVRIKNFAQTRHVEW